MQNALTKADKMFLEKAQATVVSFTYEAEASGKGHARLVHSTTSKAQQPKYHALAVAGYLAEHVTGEPGHNGPPTTTVSFTLTALGRDALGIHAPHKPPVHWAPIPSEEELAKDGIE